MSYYYLIASLPSLAIGKTPISADEFHARCASELSARDYRTLQTLDGIPMQGDVPKQAFVHAWNDRETQLRNAIAKTRARNRKVDATRVLRPQEGYDTMIQDRVENALAQSNPLERERSLDTLRWKLLDDLEGLDPFSFHVILSYAVKRKIADRWSLMDAEAGWQKAQETLEQQPAGKLRPDDSETADTHVGSQT